MRDHNYVYSYLPQRKISEYQSSQEYQPPLQPQYQPQYQPQQQQYQPQYQTPQQQQYQSQNQQHYQPPKQPYQNPQQQYYQQQQPYQYQSERQEEQRLPQPGDQTMDNTYTIPKTRISEQYSLEDHPGEQNQPKHTFVNESVTLDEDEDADEESSAKEIMPISVKVKSNKPSPPVPPQQSIAIARQPTDEDVSTTSDDRISPDRGAEDIYPISPRLSAPQQEKVTLQGFFKMLEELNSVLPQSHSRQMFYKSGIHVDENERRELLNNADKGAFKLLDDRITSEKLSCIILDQLPSIVQNLEGGYLWPDRLVKNPPIERSYESVRLIEIHLFSFLECH